MTRNRDVLVIGGGPNGLAAAVWLARRGRKVLLLEGRPTLGGLSGRVEFHPGFVVPGIRHDDGSVSDFAVSRLDLVRHGLAFRKSPTVLVAEREGPGLSLDADDRLTASRLAERSRRDADSWIAWRAFHRRVGPFVRSLMSSPPPSLLPRTLREWTVLAGRGLGLARLGREIGVDLARIAPMCAADYLNEYFTIPSLIEALAGPAVAGSWAGPWSAGTATQVLLRATAPDRRIVGGPSALIDALVRAARAAGVEIRTDARVERIRIDAGGVHGVTLAGGEDFDSNVVIATCDPKQTMLALAEPGTLPLSTEEAFRRVRSRGTTAKIHIALDGAFEIAARPGEHHEEIRLGGGHVDELERAFDAIKYRRFSAIPWLEVRLPGAEDPSLAPPGSTVLSIQASFAPHDIEGGWTNERREELGDAVVARLEEISPGIAGRIVARQVLSPRDLGREYRVSGGQLQHVDPALDQFYFMRPTPTSARYATAVPGLFLGGAGCHGSGCDAGLLAAQRALAGPTHASAVHRQGVAT